MKDQKFSFMRTLSLGFLSFFGLGFLPKAPGTFGSLGAFVLIFLFSKLGFSFEFVFFFTLILFIASCIIAQYVQKIEQVHDPGWIVIDEVVGMLVTWLFIFPSVSFSGLLATFILFRFFDIVKIFPANWFDKNVHHGFGTIMDDVISALYAGVALLALKYFHLIS